MNDRDYLLIEKIIDYCDQLEQACLRFDHSLAQFTQDSVFRNACCMCILQIGELAGALSEEARTEANDIPWKLIRGMRNIFAHNYGNINIEDTWITIQEDIPELKEKCREILTQRGE